MKNQVLIICALLTVMLISCDRQYVCDCDSSIGTFPTTVNATQKKKAKKNCEDLSYRTPENDTVQVYDCYLR